MPHSAPSKNFWKFCKQFFPNKTQILTTKLQWWKKKQSLKNKEIEIIQNNYFNDITKGLNVSQTTYMMTHL